jgi:hypothetical protein
MFVNCFGMTELERGAAVVNGGRIQNLLLPPTALRHWFFFDHVVRWHFHFVDWFHVPCWWPLRIDVLESHGCVAMDEKSTVVGVLAFGIDERSNRQGHVPCVVSLFKQE